jgi:NitT/TauT family transport system permease protein
VLIFLLLWEWAARTGHVKPLFFPAPTFIAQTVWRMISDGRLGRHLSASVLRMINGFLIGAVPGLLLGLLLGWSRRLRLIVDPIIAAAHPVPKVSLLPLVMIIFGLREISKVIVVAIVCFFPMVINAAAAVREIPPIYYEVAENYGASFRRLLTRVVAPAALPLILNAIRLSLNSALTLTLAVELVATRHGLGTLIWLAWETLRTEELYAVITVTATLGIGMNVVLRRLYKVLVPWQVERAR